MITFKNLVDNISNTKEPNIKEHTIKVFIDDIYTFADMKAKYISTFDKYIFIGTFVSEINEFELPLFKLAKSLNCVCPNDFKKFLGKKFEISEQKTNAFKNNIEYTINSYNAELID